MVVGEVGGRSFMSLAVRWDKVEAVPCAQSSDHVGIAECGLARLVY